VPYRLVGKARAQIERIVTESARRFGLPAAERYFGLMLAAFAHLDDPAAQLASTDIRALAGVRVYNWHSRVRWPRETGASGTPGTLSSTGSRPTA